MKKKNNKVTIQDSSKGDGNAPAKEESGVQARVAMEVQQEMSRVQGSEANPLRGQRVGLLQQGQLHGDNREQQGAQAEGQGGDSSRAQASREVTSKVTIGKPCKDGIHEWCANRNYDECNCECSCHEKGTQTGVSLRDALKLALTHLDPSVLCHDREDSMREEPDHGPKNCYLCSVYHDREIIEKALAEPAPTVTDFTHLMRQTKCPHGYEGTKIVNCRERLCHIARISELEMIIVHASDTAPAGVEATELLRFRWALEKMRDRYKKGVDGLEYAVMCNELACEALSLTRPDTQRSKDGK